jgi:hypothetical protein
MKKYIVHIVWLAIAIVALGGGYFWGKASVAATRAGFAGAGAYGSSTRRFAGGASGGGFTTGQIISFGNDSMTVQLANGNSEVVLYSSSTPVSEPTIVSPSVLKVGTNVMVGGTSNSDGSLTATTIQVRAMSTGSGTPAGTGQ